MRVLFSQLELMWGTDFTNQAIDEAKTQFSGPDGEVSVNAILVTAIAKILRAGALQPCPKCKSIENLHCYNLTGKAGSSQ